MKSTDNQITGQVCAKIRSMILASELRPGQRLVETDLIQTLGVGRTPVREALLLLQGEGFVARKHGWEVQGVGYTVHTVFEGRAGIEALTAGLAARKITAQACDRLAVLVERMEPGAAMPRLELNALNSEFHRGIVAAADNQLLAMFHERTLFFYWALRIPVLFPDDLLPLVNQQHRDLVEALRRRDEPTAEAIARLHVEQSMKIVEPAFLP